VPANGYDNSRPRPLDAKHMRPFSVDAKHVRPYSVDAKHMRPYSVDAKHMRPNSVDGIGVNTGAARGSPKLNSVAHAFLASMASKHVCMLR